MAPEGAYTGAIMKHGYYWWLSNKENSQPEMVYVYGEKRFTLVKRFHGGISSGQLVSMLRYAGKFLSTDPIEYS